MAVTASSLGVFLTSPQTAQAAPTNLSASNYYSSTINLGIDSATTVTVPKLPSLSVAQNFSSKTNTKQIYTVRNGDTLNSIARQYGISAEKIIKANNIKNPSQLSVNDQLIIPLEESSQVSSAYRQANDSAQNSPAVSFAVSNPITTRNANNRVNSSAIKEISTNSTNSREDVRDIYTSRLRSDINKLRDQFQNQYSDQESPIQGNNSSLANQPESFEADDNSLSNSSVNQQDDNFTLDNNLSSEEFRISSTINTIDDYNSLVTSPLKERLNPKLPPLSSPEEYLPDFFNGYMWPAQGTFTSGYGWRWGRMHRGIDIAAPIGTPIVAAATGEVIFAGWNSGGYGKLVKVKHSDGSVTLYAHNNRILVRRGQKVQQGQQIAEMGSTGFSTGPHLHFEIRTDGKNAINPIALLPKK
ncbi:MAG: peptidoglycan DD-metalloendopeptidase family protein [Xenococcus sp. (in: cyanobacteria)]